MAAGRLSRGIAAAAAAAASLSVRSVFEQSSSYHRLKRQIAMTACSAVRRHVSQTDTPLLLLPVASRPGDI